MDLDALARIFARTQPEPGQREPEPADRPEAAPAVLSPDNPMTEAPDWQEAREERAAIMEQEGGLSPEDADAAATRLHPDPGASDPAATLYGFTLAELEVAAEDDWPEIRGHPPALRGFARMRRTRVQRARGERPDHYTRAALCASCGPVWLWEPGPAHVLACPWCLDPPPAGVKIPRPPVRCGRCIHFVASAADPAAGVGACRIEAPASRTGPSLWPEVRRPCDAWQSAAPHAALVQPGACAR